MQFASDRQFRLWDYNVSHKQLLIRSPASPDVAGNIDLVFWQVEAVALPTEFDGIDLAFSTPKEREWLEQMTGKSVSSTLFCLKTKMRRSFVCAGGFKVLSNELDICESTLVYFGIERPIEWYGKVIAHS